MGRKTFLYNGMKAVSAYDLDSDVGWTVLSAPGGNHVEQAFFRRVPWLYRGAVDRSNNVASMPWAIDRGGVEKVTSDDPSTMPKDLDFLASIQLAFYKAELSLTMTGKAYFVKETNKSGYIKGLVYVSPYSIQPKEYGDDGKVISYARTINIPGKSTRTIILPAANVLAIYLPDYSSEDGPPDSSPAMAALSAAGVLWNSTAFIEQFFARGAIKASILTVESGTPAEVERLSKWYDDVVRGIRNAWASVVLRVKTAAPVVIGEGLESLQNNDLTREQRQDVASALGIPESRMWSAAANYATRQEDEVAYYRGTIIPECNVIASAFNEQVFSDIHHLTGYKLNFLPETLDVFQEDEAERASSLSQLVSAGLPLLMAMDILGYDLSDEQRAELERLLADKQQRAETFAENIQPETPAEQEQPAPQDGGQDEDNPFDEDMRRWRRKSLKALGRGESAAVPFESENIPTVEVERITLALAECVSADDVRGVFDGCKASPAATLLTELRRANDLLERLANG